MKRIVLLFLVICFVAVPTVLFAAGTTVISDFMKKGGGEYEFTYTCTADASGATFFTKATSEPIDGYVYEVIVNPGGTDASGVTPTALYDITLTDSDGIDIMGGQLANRSATESESAVPKNDGVRCDRKVNGVLTINITNNNVNSAVTVVKVRFYRP